MKNVVLAAGYATRLYPLTENFPKPLLPVGNSTILDKLIDDIDKIPDIEEHIVVVNHKFVKIFEDWKNRKQTAKPLSLVDDLSTENENRLGAVRDLLLAVEEKKLQNADLLVVAADNLLDFSFVGFVDFFHEKQTSLIMTHYEESIAALQRTGVIEIDTDRRVLAMEEKPREPKTHNAVPPFYIYKSSDVAKIKDCIAAGCNTDAPGNLVNFMLKKTVFHAWQMQGKRIDIGDLETYRKYRF
ncbi:MAG: nucleotidyltransferase family protein [Paludibacter sp.]|jgi:glucose-1-phosphate thymidylyltransferase|nr:nucleotidyltransferase family protein [Paludibacter sp.]